MPLYSGLGAYNQYRKMLNNTQSTYKSVNPHQGMKANSFYKSVNPHQGMGADSFPVKKGWFESIDWKQGMEDLAGMSFPESPLPGFSGGGKIGPRANMKFEALGGQGMPVPGTAPNPGFPLVLPRRKIHDYSGGT